MNNYLNNKVEVPSLTSYIPPWGGNHNLCSNLTIIIPKII